MFSKSQHQTSSHIQVALEHFVPWWLIIWSPVLIGWLKDVTNIMIHIDYTQTKKQIKVNQRYLMKQQNNTDNTIAW